MILRKFLFFVCMLAYFIGQCQISITSKAIKDSITTRIYSIQSQIFKAVQSGTLPTYDFDLNPLKPGKMIPEIEFSDETKTDTNNVTEKDFKGIRIKFSRQFDYNTLSITQKIENIYLDYKRIYAGVEIKGPYFLFSTEDLSKVIPSRDVQFLKLLAAAYCQNPYLFYRDTIICKDGQQFLGALLPNNVFSLQESETNYIKETLNGGFEFVVELDSFFLNIISDVIFKQYTEQQYKKETISFYEDQHFKEEITLTSYSYLFSIKYGLTDEWLVKEEKMGTLHYRDTTVSISLIGYQINSLEIYDEYCKIEFQLINTLNEIKDRRIKILNPQIIIYYIRPEDFKKFTGNFQFDFISNLYSML